MKENAAAEPFINDIKDFVRSVIEYENSPARHRTPLQHTSKNAPQRVAIGVCPRCGKNIFEGKMNYYCESGKDGCGFTIWKEPKFFSDKITPEKAAKLIKGEAVPLKAVSKEGKTYTADYRLDYSGKYVNLERVQAEKNVVGKCPRCGKSIIEGKLNFFCESGKDGCGFTLWKNDKFNGITVTAENAKELLEGKSIAKVKKKVSGESVRKKYRMVDTGTYVNLREESD